MGEIKAMIQFVVSQLTGKKKKNDHNSSRTLGQGSLINMTNVHCSHCTAASASAPNARALTRQSLLIPKQKMADV